MAEYKTNEHCIIGNPYCGHGFSSTRMCFVARPADGEFQLEEDVLRTILTERNYETYVAMREKEPGKFAFCTKICSKIITSHFCIVMLNSSKHATHPDVRIPNPNVHLEYGLMMGFHKNIIPMQRDSQTLSFNIYPIDTIKYKPDSFKGKAEDAIDDMIMRLSTKEPPGVQTPRNILQYYTLKGLRWSDISVPPYNTMYILGSPMGFNLFDGREEFVFFGYFLEYEPRQIMVNVKLLMKNIVATYERAKAATPSAEVKAALGILDRICIDVLTPENAPIDKMKDKVDDFQADFHKITVRFLRLSDIDEALKQEYESIGF